MGVMSSYKSLLFLLRESKPLDDRSPFAREGVSVYTIEVPRRGALNHSLVPISVSEGNG